MKYLIIAENDESKWKDQTGVKYHFPLKYKNKIMKGAKVIYYKGVMKNKKYLNKRLSKEPHYFGAAKIGNVYQDSEDKKAFYAEIEEYIPFIKAVRFKISGEYIENKTAGNYFRNGVRDINEDIYKKITELAKIDMEVPINFDNKNINQLSFSSIDSVNIIDKELVLKSKESNRGTNMIKEDSDTHNRSFYSNNAKNIGDRGEEIVKKYLEDRGMRNVRWLASENEKPGYDITCKDNMNNDVFIEVKATTGSKFTGFILTKNELRASKIYQDNYYIYFVTNCASEKPSISIVKNPYLKFESGEWKKECIQYRVEFNDK